MHAGSRSAKARGALRRAAAVQREASRGRLPLPAGSQALLQREGLVGHMQTPRRRAQHVASHLPGKKKVGVIQGHGPISNDAT